MRDKLDLNFGHGRHGKPVGAHDDAKGLLLLQVCVYSTNNVQVTERGQPSRRTPLLMIDLVISDDEQSLTYSTSADSVIAALQRILAHALAITQVESFLKNP
jgi:hypothetical protein